MGPFFPPRGFWNTPTKNSYFFKLQVSACMAPSFSFLQAFGEFSDSGISTLEAFFFSDRPPSLVDADHGHAMPLPPFDRSEERNGSELVAPC
jgi:hypothetical protein